jgi:hypothetical protein
LWALKLWATGCPRINGFYHLKPCKNSQNLNGTGTVFHYKILLFETWAFLYGIFIAIATQTIQCAVSLARI